MAEELIPTLHRIRQSIGEASRSLQISTTCNINHLNLCLHNLERIQTLISSTTYNTLKEAINGLMSIAINHVTSNTDGNTTYFAERVKTGGKGRSSLNISREQLLFLYEEGYTACKMAQHFKCSQSIVYKKLYEANLPMRSKYSNINDADLEVKIKSIHDKHPNSGSEMLLGYLRSQGIVVQRKRIRSILNSVDPIGVAKRWSTSIKRRTYKASTPNSLWHIDAHLKLSRWGFVTHGCIDGYSRMIIYLSCTTSIQAEPVVKLFAKGVTIHGLPSRVRSDHGYENLFVAVLMNLLRGINRGSHITGKSVHNQRIERLWVDVYKEVVDKIYRELYSLEDERLLEPDNEMHRFCIQFVYLNVINEMLESFVQGWNHHKIRTANRATPRQLWLDGMLQNYNSNYTAVEEVLALQADLPIMEKLSEFGVDASILNFEIQREPSLFTANMILTDEQNMVLQQILLLDISPKEKYIRCINIFIQ